MKPVSGQRMCQLLVSKGWSLDRINGSHHIHVSAGGPTISVPVHGNQDMRPGTQRAIMRQAGLTDADL